MGMLLRYHRDNIEADGVTTKDMVAPKPSHSAPKAEGKKEKEAEKPANIITAEEINAMNGTKLRKFAKDQGIDKPEDLTVGELRAVLLEKFS